MLEMDIERETARLCRVGSISRRRGLRKCPTIIEENDDSMELMLDKLKPIFSRLSLGSMAGYCSGYAAKNIGKAMGLVVGAGFVLIQSASYSGCFQNNIDWTETKDDAVNTVVDTIGTSSEITVDDTKAYWMKVKQMLTHYAGSAGGFSVGFLYGVKYG